MVFKLGGEEFGVNIMQVQEIIRKGDVTIVPNAPDFVEGVINLRGKITTIINLRKRLGLEDRITNEGQAWVIIVETGNGTVGVEVDSVSEVTSLPKSNIEDIPPMIRGHMDMEYLRGVGKMNGRLIILIDLRKLLNMGSGHE
ncbi:MAG: chemotaxis protein CheW [Candidatus Methanospirareceae archaeon]